ncbi:TAP42-like protein, partial [Jimgerdemannia flammicorona]
MSDSTSDLSLRGEFVAGQELHSRLEASSLSTTDAAYQRDVRAALAHFETAADLVHRVALFSVNEIVEDINTTDMRFLLVESYQGDLTLRLVGGDRVQILKTAKSYFEQFLFNCDTHDILRAEDKTRLERIKDGAVTQGGDPASARAQKIAQFQREKAIKAKIEVNTILPPSSFVCHAFRPPPLSYLSPPLNQELERHLSQTDTRSAPYSSAEFGEVDDADREFVLTLIDLHVLRTLDHLTSVAQEEVMLEEMHRMRERAGDAGGERVDLARDAARLDAGLRGGRADGPLLSKEGKVSWGLRFLEA